MATGPEVQGVSQVEDCIDSVEEAGTILTQCVRLYPGSIRQGDSIDAKFARCVDLNVRDAQRRVYSDLRIYCN